jgi:hypothetical protein
MKENNLKKIKKDVTYFVESSLSSMKEKNNIIKVDKDFEAVKFNSMKGKNNMQTREVKALIGGCDCREAQGNPNIFSRIVHADECYTTIVAEVTYL